MDKINNLSYLDYLNSFIIGGGRGSGDFIQPGFSVVNTTGWNEYQQMEGTGQISLSFIWSSVKDNISTGNGLIKVLIGNDIVYGQMISQGSVSIDVTEYLNLGQNIIKVTISDSYQHNKTETFLINILQRNSFTISYYNGDTLITTQTVVQGQSGNYTGETPTKEQDAQYTYTFAGWSKTDDNTVDADALTAVTADRNVYACFTQTLRKYTVTFVRASADGGGTLQTINNVDYGTVITAASSYTGSTPTTTQGSVTDYPFEGWNPASATVEGDTSFTAKFGSPVEVAEITDSWDTIIANIDNGTYSSVYKIGNYKPLDLGTEGTINMQIVAMDADELPNGGYAPLTFIGMEALNTDNRMNPSRSGSSGAYNEGTGAIGGWEKCEMRTYLKETIKPLIPTNVRTRINNVTKYSRICDTTGTAVNNVASTEDVWIPSASEIWRSGETQGVRYDSIFSSDASRVKRKVGASNASWWWLRTARDGRNFWNVSISGGSEFTNTQTSGSVCLGFCLGLEPET